MKTHKLIAYAILFVSLPVSQSTAQTSIPLNTVVTQNFNAIGASATAALPANWKMSSAGTGSTSGWATGTNITATTQAASSGSPSTGGAYNWATSAGTDRAIGFMASGSYASPNSVMAFYRNTTGATVTSITVTFAIERYRINTATFSLAFFSSTDGTAWTARNAGDISTSVFATGASAYTFGSPQIIYKTVTISGLNILNNGDFYLRWIFTNTGGANSQGLGLDDVSLYAGAATPIIVAKLRDALTIDNPPINQANPGDQLTYTNVIKNTATGDANGVTLTEPAPTNTTFVPGSAKTSSLAKDESFATPFNTALMGNNVLTNDFGVPSPAVLSFGPTSNAAATAANGSGTSDNGGTVVVNSNGTFTYTPLAGFTGIDKFAYIAGNGNLPNNDAIVTVTVGSAAVANNESYSIVGNVSILPNAAAGVLTNDGGNGITITAVNGSAANVATPITTSGGGNLTVNADGSFTYNPPAGFEGADNFTYTIDNGFASPQTATVTLNISGMVWFINAAAAAGGDGRLSTPFNTIAAYNAAAGANPPAVNDNICVYENAAAYTGSFTLLNGQRLIGQDATATLSTITGLTPNATYSTAFPAMNTGAPVTTLSTTVAATNAVNLNSAAGTNLLRGFTLGNTTGSGISGSGFGTLTISDVSKNGTGQALALTSGAFGATATIDNITTTNSVNAVSLTTITGTLTITTGAISGATGTAFNVSGGTVSITYSGGITQANIAAMVSIAGGHVTGTITFNTGTLSATNGTGLQFDNADGVYNFNGPVTLNGGDAGIDIINGSSGNFTFSNAPITNPTGVAFLVNGGNGTINHTGIISKTSAGRLIDIQARTGGSVTINSNLSSTISSTGINVSACTGGAITFAGATKTMNTPGVNPVNIATNTGATITFSGGGLAITSTTATGFNATGGGTINVTGTGNTITSTTGTALNVVSTSFGGSGATFQSISSSGGANGILLNSSSGNLTVTGDGSGFANGSGGSLSNITGGVLGNAPVYMLTASGIITLRSMNMSLNTNCYSGMLVDNNASGNVTVNVVGCTFIGVTASVVQNKSLLQFEAGGAANVTANVQNSYFSSNRTYGVFATGAGTSILNVTINQCGFGTDINTGSPVNNPGTNITNPPPFSVGVTNGSSSLVNYLISNNTFWGADGLLGATYAVTISGASTTASSRLIGTFSGNRIGKTGVTGSGAANNSGGLGLLPGTGGIFQATVINNDIRQVNALGINFKNSVTGATGTSNVKIKGNTIAEPDPTGAPLFQRAIIVDPGNSGGASMTACAEIGGPLGGEPNIISGAWQVGNFIRVTNNNNTVALRLPGLIPSAAATAAQVNAFVQANNTMAASSVNTSLGTAGIVGGAVCF